MKKLFFIAALIFCAGAVMAQGRAQFGVKGGLNVSNLHYDNGTEQDSKISFHVGALAHIHITRHFALQPELLYSSQGVDQTNGYTVNLNYINLPVLLQYMSGSGFRLETGPQVGFLVNAEAENNDVEFNAYRNFKNVDFSWSVGAGYLFHSGFGLDARYNLGLSNINDLTSTKITNRVFQAGVFYQFKRH